MIETGVRNLSRTGLEVGSRALSIREEGGSRGANGANTNMASSTRHTDFIIRYLSDLGLRSLFLASLTATTLPLQSRVRRLAQLGVEATS